MAITTVKSLIGKEDLKVQKTTGDFETFVRFTPTGGQITLTKFPDLWEGSGQINIKKLIIPDENSTVLHAMGDITSSSANQPGTTTSIIDRGDPTDPDFASATLTKDNDWHDLDCSLIVPYGAKWIILGILFVGAVAQTSYIKMRKNDNANDANIEQLYCQVNLNPQYGTFMVSCDSNRTIEYLISGASDNANIYIRGWVF